MRIPRVRSGAVLFVRTTIHVLVVGSTGRLHVYTLRAVCNMLHHVMQLITVVRVVVPQSGANKLLGGGADKLWRDNRL